VFLFIDMFITDCGMFFSILRAWKSPMAGGDDSVQCFTCLPTVLPSGIFWPMSQPAYGTCC
jgi:hypothetical protein